jgi:uncharacterized cupin superfamily protein
VPGGIVHWDDVEPVRRAEGHIAGNWRLLGAAAGSVGVGVNRVQLDPGRWSSPAHVEATAEEIFYILDGDGLSWQDGEVYEVGPGDCIVHRAREEAHTLRGGERGLDYLVFGQKGRSAGAHVPRAGVSWLWPTWVEAGGGDRPLRREAAAGEPAVGEPADRPENIVNVEALKPDAEGDRVLGHVAGAEQSGLHHRTLQPGRPSVPAHCHSAEEEFFVMLTGTAVLELIPGPRLRLEGAETERHELQPGHAVARPGGTRISHHIVGGPEGGTMLVYGTKDPNDIAYYPHSNKINFRGVGLIARLDALEYADGETEFGG